VVGLNLSAAARVALAAARATAHERRVALADLAGALSSLGVVAPDAAAPGITESFLHGTTLNDVARPAADGTPGLYILPRGHEALTAEVMQSDRWRRLAAGFADAGALLLIIAALDAPALASLVHQTDGVVTVGAADVPLDWRVIAQVGESSAPESPPAAPLARPRRVAARRLAVGIAAAACVVAGVLLWPRLRQLVPAAPAGARTGAAPASTSTPSTPVRARGIAPPADTVRVPEPVNPPDSAEAAQFAVEIVATNTVAGANLWLRERGARLPGVTVSPVVIGAASTRWQKVLAGAWRERAGAESLLKALRDDGVLRPGAGLVVRVPLALVLESGVPRGDANARVAALAARGVRAYALLQDDGSVRLFAGAFETAAAAVPLDAELRAAGFAPQLAYRTGRMF
jgi:hypothetical protein